jgi:hypothetical protein
VVPRNARTTPAAIAQAIAAAKRGDADGAEDSDAAVGRELADEAAGPPAARAGRAAARRAAKPVAESEVEQDFARADPDDGDGDDEDEGEAPEAQDEDEDNEALPSAEGAADEAGKTDKPEEPDPKKVAPARTWASLFRQQKAVQAREEALKSERAQLTAQREQEQPTLREAQQLLAEFKADPFGFVEKRGYDFEAWAKQRANRGQPTDADRVKREFESKFEEFERRQKEDQANRERAANEARMAARAEAWLEAVPQVLQEERYSLIRDWGADEEVANLAAIELRQSGKWLTQREAADRILHVLEERLARVEAKRKPAAPPPAPSTEKKPARQSPRGSDGQFAQKKPVKKRAANRPQSSMERQAEVQRAAQQLRWRT